jgi:hypothetical protein
MTASTHFLYPPALNVLSKGAVAAEAFCFCLTQELYDLGSPGTPVNGVAGTGTGAGFAGIGSRYTDTTAGKLYINTGTKLSPVWTVVGSQS